MLITARIIYETWNLMTWTNKDIHKCLMYSCIKKNNYFFILSSMLLYGCIIICLSIHPSVDIWVASSFRLVWIKSLWTIVYRLLWEHKFLLLWDKCHRVWLLTYFEHVYLVLKENTELFSRVTVPFFIPTSSVWKIFPPCLNSV